VRFTRADLESFRDATVADLIGPDPDLVFVGIKGMWRTLTRLDPSSEGRPS
jgi:double-stranded uracil-DNA glycosylase